SVSARWQRWHSRNRGRTCGNQTCRAQRSYPTGYYNRAGPGVNSHNLLSVTSIAQGRLADVGDCLQAAGAGFDTSSEWIDCAEARTRRRAFGNREVRDGGPHAGFAVRARSAWPQVVSGLQDAAGMDGGAVAAGAVGAIDGDDGAAGASGFAGAGPVPPEAPGERRPALHPLQDAHHDA